MAKGFFLPIDDKFSLNLQTSMYWNCPLPQQHCGSFWVTARYQIQHRQKPCDAEASCGYVGAAGCEIIELDVICLNGEGCTLRLSGSILGITANPSPNIKKRALRERLRQCPARMFQQIYLLHGAMFKASQSQRKNLH